MHNIVNHFHRLRRYRIKVKDPLNIRKRVSKRFYRSSHFLRRKFGEANIKGKTKYGLKAIFFVLFIGVIFAYKRRKNQKKNPEELLWEEKMITLLKKLPSRFGSRLWGDCCYLEIPEFMRWAIIGSYAKVFGCNLEEAEKPLNEYTSLGSFFARNLKSGTRHIDHEADIVSPVDGKVLHYGEINKEDQTLEQIKGISYSLSGLVGDDNEIFNSLKNLKENHNLYYIIIYLAPGDYHGYHSPVPWKIDERVHYPGHLFSVSPFAVRRIRNLFSLNERVVLSGTWKHGYFCYIPVGAYNVGSMKLKFEPEFKTNRSEHGPNSVRDRVFYEGGVSLEKGEGIGFFNMGSTVVMLFEAPPSEFQVEKNVKVKLGEPILKIK